MGKRFPEEFDRIGKVKSNDKLLINDSGDGLDKYATPAQFNASLKELEMHYDDAVAAKEGAEAAQRAATEQANKAEAVLGAALGYTLPVTWGELKALRDGGKLKAGQSYRITDFVTTSAQEETTSAGHPFDIIVTADDGGTLNENARAILHDGDTYFADSNLSAWELKYCLDNDPGRFAWADTTNGKGVVWWMRDEWGNECFYDFKNIQFKLYAGEGPEWESYIDSLGLSLDEIVPYRITEGLEYSPPGDFIWWADHTDFIWAYTWSAYEGAKRASDKSIKVGKDDQYENTAHDCKVGANWEEMRKDDGGVYRRLSLNFYIAIPFMFDSKDESFSTYGITIGEGCHDIVTGRDCHSWSCGNSCYSWACGDSCYSWSCGDSCDSWSCGDSCHSWVCGNSCDSWSCGNSCDSWSCGNSCYSWACGNSCDSWSCGNSCYSWACGNSCDSWSCGNNCNSWRCGSYSGSWVCGNNCHSWRCDNYSGSWVCGNNCHSWKCGNYSDSWVCGNNCHSWSCGYGCFQWSCGNYCRSWKCGNNCKWWSCGNYCYSWECAPETTGKPQNNVSQFRLEDGVNNISIKSSGTPTDSAPLKNFVVRAGVKGTDSKKLAVVVDAALFPLNSDYEWTIAKNSKGEIKQYCEADLI